MIIAVNTRILSDDSPDEHKDFIYETLKRIISRNPGHQYILIADKKSNVEFVTATSVQLVVTDAASQSPFLWKYWLDVRIKNILKKYKADVFISFDGICLTSKVPQCLVLQNLYSEASSFIKKNQQKFYKKFTDKFLDKAAVIAVTSELLKQKIIDEYKTEVSKIEVVYGGANKKFVPASPDEKQTTKNKYTDGKDFFLYTGSIHPYKNIITLLKAFSVFKKRQQTNMKLVLAGKISKNYQSFSENLKSYKYKSDVVLIENAEESECIKITASALAFIDASQQEGFSAAVIEALQCDIPVIIAENFSMQILNDAAIYFDANDHKAVSDKMMLIYKDEKLQKQLIQQGKLIRNIYNWDKTADLIWQSLCKAVP